MALTRDFIKAESLESIIHTTVVNVLTHRRKSREKGELRL